MDFNLIDKENRVRREGALRQNNKNSFLCF